MGARVVATKHWSKGDQISSLIGKKRSKTILKNYSLTLPWTFLVFRFNVKIDLSN